MPKIIFEAPASPPKRVIVPVLRHVPLKWHPADELMYYDEASDAFYYPGEKPAFDQVELNGPGDAVDIILARLAQEQLGPIR